MSEEAEIAWLAGLLEGEGSFQTINSWVNGKAYRYPKITVNMTDLDVIEHVARLFGTKVYVMPIYVREGYAPPKQQWRATSTGKRAAEWMRKLYPYLGSRRQARIDEVLAEYAALEPTESRRQKACSEAAAGRTRVGGRFAKSN